MMRIKKRTLKVIGLVIIALLLICGLCLYRNKNQYAFQEDSFSYSSDRGRPEYSISLRSHNETFDVYDVDFKSRPFLEYPARVYGLLLMPKNHGKVPGVVLLPGGGISKEAEFPHAAIIANRGYAVLVIDQRGIGQTDGNYPSFEDDAIILRQGKEPIQHLCVYDALRASDVLREMTNVDKEKIALVGLSMGGRYAIIAGALDKKIKGVIAISSAGFHVSKDNSPESGYFLSIDPDQYISRISPNYLFMIHGTNDTKVPIQDAEITFSIAKEPKKFFEAKGCGHGYCDNMHENLKSALKEIFGQ